MKRRHRTLLFSFAVVGAALFATAAEAQPKAPGGIVPEKAAPPAATPAAPDKGEKGAEKGKEGGGDQRGVITLAEVTITGRIQKPIAAVDVSRIQPKLTLAELRQPFLERIEKAIYSDPF